MDRSPPNAILRYIRLKYFRLRRWHSDFDPEFYRDYYSDLSDLRSKDDLLEHYIDHGFHEGRFKNAGEARKTLRARFKDLPAEFDDQGYRSIVKDNPYTLFTDSRLERLDAGINRKHRPRKKIGNRKASAASGSHRQVVYAYRHDGIGTRIITALHACVFADIFGLDFKVIWPKFEEPFCDEKLLFQPNSKQEIFSNGHLFKDMETKRGELIDPGSLHGRNILKASEESKRLATMDLNATATFIADFDGVVYDRPYPLAPFMKHDIDISSEIKTLWKTVSWSREIVDALDKISARLALHECIAVHVRRGDIVNMLAQASVAHLRDIGMRQIFHRHTAMPTILDEIDRVRTDENIVVCSEDRNVVETLRKKYGADTVFSSADLCECTEGQRAAIDLILLSRAKVLIAPFTSYFSLCAATVGDCAYIPVALDLSAIVTELLQAAGTAIADDKQRSSVCALIYATAAEFAPDEGMRAAFEQDARAIERPAASAAADRPTGRPADRPSLE